MVDPDPSMSVVVDSVPPSSVVVDSVPPSSVVDPLIAQLSVCSRGTSTVMGSPTSMIAES